MQLDHLVINTGLGMDGAAAIFADLGFHLTPRGHHSLGSINHLMMDPVSYLELVGVPATGKQRQDVLDSPIGLSGLVFRSEDAGATYARLRSEGFDPQEPILLERPVDVEGTQQMARFHNVRMTFAEFPVGRVYFCQHLTPELVWRDEWLDHPNGFRGITSMTLHSPDPAAEAARYAMLAEGRAERRGDGWAVIGTGFDMMIRQGADAFTDATLTFDGVERIAARASASDAATWQEAGEGAGILTIASLGVTLRCQSARPAAA
ncbi:VOC family protein [Roseovarius nanhaiticus]|uniref:VOC family protein n=1 Tax=Roseovarius nanhaiticus TaxID=573024 RepID=UPI00248F5C84|nr:VOC family protein [Roseovarius nanhaiticus]